MARRGAAVLLSVAFSLLGGTSVAAARAAGTWTQVTDSTGSNIDEVSLARTSSGALHIAWTRPDPSHPSASRDLLDRTVSSGGSVGSANVIAANWSYLSNPALLATGGNGLDLFVAAIRSTKSTETITNLAWFSSSNGGSSWSLYPHDVTKSGSPSDPSAGLGSGGTPFEAWGSSSCLCVHRGTLSSTPNHDFQTGLGDFGYDPGMARDPASGRLAVAWYSNGTGHNGVYAATIDQTTGARSGSPMQMPSTSNLHDGPFSGRTPIVGRAGGGLYVAYEGGYPSHTQVLLWRMGASHSIVIAHNRSGVGSVGVASTPTGRIWVFWSTSSASGAPLIHARRSNTSATAWGAPVTLKSPRHASASWNLVGNGQARQLDLVGSFSLGTSSHTASWYTQVLPGLTLKASPHRLHTGTAKAQKVTFTVSDAGASVSGAHVKVDHLSGVTDSQGKVTLRLGPFKHKTHLVAHATRSGYAKGSTVVKVR